MDPDFPQPDAPTEAPPPEVPEAPIVPDPVSPPDQPISVPIEDDTPPAEILPISPVEPVAEPSAPIEEPVVPTTDPIAIPATPQSTVAQPEPQTVPLQSISPLQSPIIPEQVTPEMASLFQSWLTAYQKSFRSLGTLGLKRKHQKHLDRVVELVGERGSVTRRELQLAMRLSAPTIDKYTHELVALGRLRHVGAPSHGRYERV